MLVMNAQTSSFARRIALLTRFPQKILGDECVVSYREANPVDLFEKNTLPVVMLHGIGSGAASWVKQLDSLGATRRMLAWDAPGYGASASLGADSPVASDYATVLQRCLDAWGIERCVLVGHSLGAIMAGAFAAAFPERLAGLLLLSPAGGYGNADPAVRVAKREARLAMVRTLGPAGMAQARSANMVSSFADEGAREWIKKTMSEVHIRGYSQATHLLADANLSADLSLYRGKLAVVVGAEDSITTPTSCEAIARSAGVSLRVVPRAGHAGYVEASAVYSELIDNFCIECDRAEAL